MYVCMDSGIATGKALPFRNTLPSPLLLREQLHRWRERVCRCRDDGAHDGQGASPSHRLYLKSEGILPSKQRARRPASKEPVPGLHCQSIMCAICGGDREVL